MTRLRPRALIVVAHPDPVSFNHAIAGRLALSWSDAGLDVRMHDLHAEGFDPVMTLAEHRGQSSGDQVVEGHIADLGASDLLGVVHPNCWGAPPAIMKGWIDRVFASGSAYGFEKGEDNGDVPIGLLCVRGALVINTGNTPAERERLVFGDPLGRIWRDCLLSYCGVSHIEREVFGVVATSTREQRIAWLDRASELAARLATHVRSEE